uniref:Transposase n=1 Tax=Steinernema glaseri TaxID=37863 RepID=A0A1I8AT35_9BILA
MLFTEDATACPGGYRLASVVKRVNRDNEKTFGVIDNWRHARYEHASIRPSQELQRQADKPFVQINCSQTIFPFVLAWSHLCGQQVGWNTLAALLARRLVCVYDLLRDKLTSVGITALYSSLPVSLMSACGAFPHGHRPHVGPFYQYWNARARTL